VAIRDHQALDHHRRQNRNREMSCQDNMRLPLQPGMVLRDLVPTLPEQVLHVLIPG